MSSPVSELPTLELKYCERCGALYLRPGSSRAVYCAACARRMRRLPPADGLSVARSAGPSAPDDGSPSPGPSAPWVLATERPMDGQAEETRCSQ